MKVQAHLLRKRFGKILRLGIGRTVSDASMIDEEIGDLFKALTGPVSGSAL